MENTSSDYEGTNYSSSRSVTWSMDEMDYLMDHCIEIDSNRRMREQFIKPIQLTFRDSQLEGEVRDRIFSVYLPRMKGIRL